VVGELPEQLTAAHVELFGHDDLDVDDLVAPAPAIDPRKALAPQAELAATLGPGRHLHLDAALHRGHFDRRAERRLAEGHGDAEQDIVTLTLEVGVVLDGHHEDQVPRRTAVDPGLAPATDTDFAPAVDPGGDFDLEPVALAVTERQLLAAVGLLEADRNREAPVDAFLADRLALPPLERAALPALAAAESLAEQLLEDIVDPADVLALETEALGASAPRCPALAENVTQVLEVDPLPGSPGATGPRAAEPGRPALVGFMADLVVDLPLLRVA